MFRTTTLAATMLILAALAPVHATTQTINFSKTLTFGGYTATVSGTLTVDTTAKTVVGAVTVLVVDSTGKTVFSQTFNVNLMLPSTNAANMVLAFLTMAASCGVNATDSSTSCMVTKNPDLNFNGKVDISDVSALGAAYGTTAGYAKFNSAADLNGDGKVDIVDASIMGADWQAPVYY